MTWQPLSEQKPRAGQAVIYRLRPNGVEAPAIYDPKQPAWVLEDGPHQTARPHHQWIPAEEPAPSPAKACSAPGCDQPAVARGMCNKHYQRDYARRKRAAATPMQTLKPAKQPARAQLDPTTRELLREAMQHHPELGKALTGEEVTP